MDLKTIAALLPLLPIQAKRQAGLRAFDLALIVIVALLGLAMIGFLCLSLFFALEPHFTKPLAALTTAGVLFVVMLLLLLIMLLAEKRSKARQDRERQDQLRIVSESGMDGLTAIAVALIGMLGNGRK